MHPQATIEASQHQDTEVHRRLWKSKANKNVRWEGKNINICRILEDYSLTLLHNPTIELYFSTKFRSLVLNNLKPCAAKFLLRSHEIYLLI